MVFLSIGLCAGLLRGRSCPLNSFVLKIELKIGQIIGKDRDLCGGENLQTLGLITVFMKNR